MSIRRGLCTVNVEYEINQIETIGLKPVGLPGEGHAACAHPLQCPGPAAPARYLFPWMAPDWGARVLEREFTINMPTHTSHVYVSRGTPSGTSRKRRYGASMYVNLRLGARAVRFQSTPGSESLPPGCRLPPPSPPPAICDVEGAGRPQHYPGASKNPADVKRHPSTKTSGRGETGGVTVTGTPPPLKKGAKAPRDPLAARLAD